MVVVGDVGDVDERLMIDGADVHAVMILIAFMFHSYSRAVSPISSLARGPSIDSSNEDLKYARWEVCPIPAPWAKILLGPVSLRSDSSGGSMRVWLG